jgi:hypothetical protein
MQHNLVCSRHRLIAPGGARHAQIVAAAIPSRRDVLVTGNGMPENCHTASGVPMSMLSLLLQEAHLWRLLQLP